MSQIDQLIAMNNLPGDSVQSRITSDISASKIV